MAIICKYSIVISKVVGSRSLEVNSWKEIFSLKNRGYKSSKLAVVQRACAFQKCRSSISPIAMMLSSDFRTQKIINGCLSCASNWPLSCVKSSTDLHDSLRDCVWMFSLSGGEVFEKIIDDNYELTEKEVIGYVQQVCQGLKFMHNKSIIHLDIKVSNMLTLLFIIFNFPNSCVHYLS